MAWSVPKIDGLSAAFQLTDAGLTPANGTPDVTAFEDRAALTAQVWQSLQLMQDVGMMIIKSEKGTSIGQQAGGLIIEGRGTLNVGLVRAATKKFDFVDVPAPESKPSPCATRDRRILWALLSRLMDTACTRVFSVDLAGEITHIRVADGALYFGGENNTPATFAAALKAAAETDGTVAYTLADPATPVGEVAYSDADLCNEIFSSTDEKHVEIDPDGWPLAIPSGASFKEIAVLSAVGTAACKASDVMGALTLTAMSAQNQPLIRGTTTDDRSIIFSVW